MAPRHDPPDDPFADGSAVFEVQHLLHRVSSARLRGHPLVAEDQLREAQALAAALAQYQAALNDARRQVGDLTHEMHTVWEQVADDRTLHDLADDAGVLLALSDDLDRAWSRLITLEMTRP